MLICGLKLTHDGAVAILDGNRLLHCIEMENVGTRARYASIEDSEDIARTLKSVGVDPSDVDAFVIDGWGGYNADELAVQPRLKIGADNNTLSLMHRGDTVQLGVSQYTERARQHSVLEEKRFSGLPIGQAKYDYSSYFHVTGHIMSAYCASPFARQGEASFVLIWDGGMFPHLYYVDPRKQGVENLGPLFMLIGNAYTIFSQHFGPFKVKGFFAMDDLSIAGKVMAYIALGENQPELFATFDDIWNDHFDKPMGFANILATEFKKRIQGKGYSDEDILCTFHNYLEKVLVERLKKKIERHPGREANLCFAGGCALNIKWNSALRESGMFEDVFVPPFPNDSGSAIGQACTKRFVSQGKSNLDWSVYSGPEIMTGNIADGWRAEKCSPKELAAHLNHTGEPVVFLNGCAELGPRALGNRSILAPATNPAMKQRLNEMKNREDYRPVAPICMVADAPEIFNPGNADPHMLFDHSVRDAWVDRIPAIIHLDGTARLQTISPEDNPTVYNVLYEYKRLSGVPLLCNTSANEKDCGFFPDVAAAAAWGRTQYIWHANTLYTRIEE